MNLHCVLGIWEQRVPWKATLGSSKRNEKIVSAQYRLHSSGANRWRLHLAEKPMGGDSPIQLQDANAHSPSLNMLCQPNHSCVEASTSLWLELVRVERTVTAWAWERLGTFVYKNRKQFLYKCEFSYFFSSAFWEEWLKLIWVLEHKSSISGITIDCGNCDTLLRKKYFSLVKLYLIYEEMYCTRVLFSPTLAKPNNAFEKETWWSRWAPHLVPGEHDKNSLTISCKVCT